MVRGILQFTPGIAFRYVLHRCESRDIRCRESLGVSFFEKETRGASPFVRVPWRGAAPGFSSVPLPEGRGGGARPAPGGGGGRRSVTGARVVLGGFSTMILPQVHLRKPCYDFSFL